jgi:hypothetical protein
MSDVPVIEVVTNGRGETSNSNGLIPLDKVMLCTFKHTKLCHAHTRNGEFAVGIMAICEGAVSQIFAKISLTSGPRAEKPGNTKIFVYFRIDKTGPQ